MPIATPIRLRSTLLSLTLCSGLLLSGGCASRPETQEAIAPSAPQSTGLERAGDSAAPETEWVAQSSTEAVPQAAPQLVKTATVTIAVESLDASIDAVSRLTREQQGDVLELQDQLDRDQPHPIASLRVRVPQGNLEAMLTALEDLGQVQERSIRAEDVSNQLVDHQARLRNLRKTEEMLLGIMERSGEVADVLTVAQEVSNVRNAIEQIDAQLKDLQNRVAYSTVSITLAGAIATAPARRAVPLQLHDTWTEATRSITNLTLGVVKLGIWFLVYSPYWLLIAIALLTYHHYRRRHRRALPADRPSASE